MCQLSFFAVKLATFSCNVRLLHKGTCATIVSDDNICTVVHGSVTLFINKESNGDVAFIRYVARSLIEESMSEGFYIAPLVAGLEMVTYRGPKFTMPVYDDDDVYFLNQDGLSQSNMGTASTNSGMTKMEIIVVASLVSAVMGIAFAMFLSKKAFSSGQNCLAACDGTGIDVKYMEDAAVVASLDEDASEVQWNSNTGLSAIDEMSEAPSYLTRDSHATSVTPFSRRTGISDDNSIHSEKTHRISNKFSTPSFGSDAVQEVSHKKNNF